MRARKRFGQHFLAPEWADKLVAAIEPRPDDRFLEIGPGPGALTLRLARRVQHVTAVEIDRDITAALAPMLPANVELIEADFLALDLGPVLSRAPLRVAGNLPYNVATPILFRLLDIWRGQAGHDAGAAKASDCPAESPPWTDATLMVQQEVADRLEARPGSRDFGVLSIAVQRHAGVNRLLALPPGAFRPVPKVHSAVVQLTFRPSAVPVRDERLFEEMVRSVFTQRRKTLRNALAPFAASRHADARAALVDVGIDPARRPETLEIVELARLADWFGGSGVRGGT